MRVKYLFLLQRAEVFKKLCVFFRFFTLLAGQYCQRKSRFKLSRDVCFIVALVDQISVLNCLPEAFQDTNLKWTNNLVHCFTLITSAQHITTFLTSIILIK